MLCCLAAGALLLDACSPDGTRKTALGREYTLHTDAGGEPSQPGDFIYFHYVMRTLDSTLANTREMGQEPYTQHPPDSLGTDQIDEVTDVVRSLAIGDSATVVMRIDTFTQKPPGLEDVNEIFFDIVATDIVDEATFNERLQREQAEAQARMQAAVARAPQVQAFADSVRQAYVDGQLSDELQRTESGLGFIIHEPGDGPAAEPGQMVEVHYIGMLTDGTVFDQSFPRGQPISFPLGVGAVITGWDEGLSLLDVGAQATFFIPAELGYGDAEQGPIPANSELIFYVELEGAK
jgi:FKBP-type peptidyl-prolyl cis-trans isomerase FkpA